jgi:2-hydroxy-6-oxonona-2,4-dienedioate hydrolase
MTQGQPSGARPSRRFRPIPRQAHPVRWIVGGTVLALLAVGGASYAQFLRDMGEARAVIQGRSQIVDTPAGTVEYADVGSGYPVLSIHGAGGGFDQGIANAASMLDAGFRTIAPSRFGYLGTPVPADTSVTAQADAHLALLDLLEVERAVVLGTSAGTRSALELAMRHPERVAALVLVVPATYAPGQTPLTPQREAAFPVVLWLVNAGADFAWWAMEHLYPDALIRFIGVPPEVVRAASAEDRAAVMAMVRSIEPLSLRYAGINVDSQPQLAPLPMAELAVPTLLITARDDLFGTLQSAEYAATQIPGARLVVYDSGGHLLVGHGPEVRAEIRDFLATVAAGSE